MNSSVHEIESRIRKSEWSSRLGAGPFEWSTLPVSSKNQLYRLKTSKGDFVVKVFAMNPYGEKSAFSEYAAFHSLRDFGVKSLPDYLGRFENGVVIRYLEQAAPVDGLEAYRCLENFLRQTRDLETSHFVTDDSDSKRSFLFHLRSRLNQLQLEKETRVHLEEIYAHLNHEQADFRDCAKRFILSDFHPGQVVTSHGEIYFLDLEHAGMGDPRRFFCNLLLHPKGCLSAHRAENIQETLGLRAEDVATVFPFSFMEWILIVLNFCSKEREHRDLDAETIKQRQSLAQKLIHQAFRWMGHRHSWFELYLSERNRL